MDETAAKLVAATSDRYRIVRKLGAGGMADVYLAEDLRHGREVAVKVIRPELAMALGQERFLREIRLLARLQHPNIVALVDSGDAGGTLFYVMPFVAGGSLRARLERERELPIADAVQILREVAGALEHAHASGIVHRDVKPENVLFSSGHAQVADFGIARILDRGAGGTALTTVGTTMGTPAYMAPEQASGDPHTDHRADIYSFGVLAYELLAGAPPFVASSAAALVAMHLGETPTPVSRRRPSVSAAIEDVVMRCLEKRPADRWQSARELLAALNRADEGKRGNEGRARGEGTVTAHLTITEARASRLDRSSFDPRMIGDALEYLDNRVESNVLVMLIHAPWLLSSDLEPHLRTLPYRCVAPTLYGFSLQARHRFPLSFRDHVTLLAELLEEMVTEARPALVVVAGYSAAGDMALKLPGVMSPGARVPDGLLTFGANQGLETCFVSRVLARLESSDPSRLLDALRTIGEAVSSLDDWMLLNGYLGQIVTRFRTDVDPLRVLGRDIVQPFERDDAGAFATMYREATEKVRCVRCVFEDSEICNRLLRQVLTEHMDRGILGPHHRDGSLLIEPTPSHFELIHVDRVAAHLAAVIEQLRAAG